VFVRLRHEKIPSIATQNKHTEPRMPNIYNTKMNVCETWA
jgi:hypothetical protein